MILTALKDLAENESLINDPDYEPKPVTHVIELASGGKLLGITDIRVPDRKGKPRAAVQFIPKIAGRTSGIAAQFLYDKSDYVFGLKPEKNGSVSPSVERLHAAIALTREAAMASADDGLQSVLGFMNAMAADVDRARDAVAGLDPKELGNYWFIFRLHGDATWVSNREKVAAWWRQHRRVAGGQPTAVCLITGVPCVPVDKHDGVKKLPGGSTSGVSLVSFNSGAFESYGLSRNENAPISRTAAEAYVRALNRLLDPAWPKSGMVGETLPNRRVVLNDNTAVVFWTADPASDFADVFDALFETAEEGAVKRLFESPKSGNLPYLDAKTPFYVLTLSGGQGRATVRGWSTDTVADVAARLRRWFEDIELGSELDHAPRPSIRALLRSVAVLGKDENMPPNLAAEIFDAVVRSHPLPLTLLGAAVRRNKAEGPGGSDRVRAHLRMQLLKATILRLKRAYPESYATFPEVLPMLDETNATPAYLLGRLFSALERLQESAQGQTNATISDRFYGAASTAPSIAFPRLMGLSRHHLSKLRKEKPGFAVTLDRTMGEILDNLPGVKFPTILTMEEQGLFALGYYHQRQRFFRKKSEQGDDAPQIED